MDRPCRRVKTKVVNYCENKDLEDDEDFACSKAPPSKKPREEMGQEKKKSAGRSSSQETTPKSVQSEKIRKPLDEKLYERDLDAAITLSLLNNSGGLMESPTNVKVQNSMDENTDPASLLLSNCCVDGALLGLDEITSEKASTASDRQRKTSTKAPEEQRKKDEDEDYKPKLMPDSESDEDFSEPDESDDEEFTVKKASKAKRKEKGPKKDKAKPSPAPRKEKKRSKPSHSKPNAAAVSPPGRSPPAVKPAPCSSASSSPASTVKPVSSLSPAGGRLPKWTPPAQIGKSPTSSQTPAVKSPSAGLRLGLSRLVRVKPLHPSVASH